MQNHNESVSNSKKTINFTLTKKISKPKFNTCNNNETTILFETYYSYKKKVSISAHLNHK